MAILKRPHLAKRSLMGFGKRYKSIIGTHAAMPEVPRSIRSPAGVGAHQSGSATMPSGISCSRDRAKPSLMEAQKTLARKRLSFARVIERLRSPPLSHGMARELKKQQAQLEHEIAELKSEPACQTSAAAGAWSPRSGASNCWRRRTAAMTGKTKTSMDAAKASIQCEEGTSTDPPILSVRPLARRGQKRRGTRAISKFEQERCIVGPPNKGVAELRHGKQRE